MKTDIHPNSIQAFLDNKMEGHTQSWRLKIWAAFKLAGAPLTDRDVVAILEQRDKTNIQPQITTMKQEGLLREVDRITCPITNKTVRVCTLTDWDYFPEGHGPMGVVREKYHTRIQELEAEVLRLKGIIKDNGIELDPQPDPHHEDPNQMQLFTELNEKVNP